VCRALCGYEYEPANKQERKWWRKRFYDNHGHWPDTAKQEREGRKPKTPKAEPKDFSKIVYQTSKTDKWGGDLPEQEQNDNGWGYHTVYPQTKCPHCPAAFHNSTNLPKHIQSRHPEQDGGEGMAGVPA
jgi:hypothetical protein